MRISVVVLVYNLGAYVRQAIDSVLQQTRKADEVIVVDDCSTDDSAECVRAYGEKLRYLRMPENSGALMAGLHGVKAATGDIVCMLDGDDYWASNKLEVVERAFSNDPDLVLLSHEHVRVSEVGRELGVRDETHENIARIRRRAQSPADLSQQLKETILEQRGYWLGSAYSFRKSLFDVRVFEAQISEFGLDRLKSTYLDLVIAPFLVLTNRTKNVGYAPETHFFYRVHDQGSMAGGATPEKARQLALKGRNLNQLIAFILRENGASAAHLARRKMIIQHYDYLAALYERDIGKAARLYAQLATKHWTWRDSRKEALRFAAVAILGTAKFLALK